MIFLFFALIKCSVTKMWAVSFDTPAGLNMMRIYSVFRVDPCVHLLRRPRFEAKRIVALDNKEKPLTPSNLLSITQKSDLELPTTLGDY